MHSLGNILQRGFKNLKLLEKIQKRFAVFGDIWTESYIQFGFIVRVSLHLKRTDIKP